MEGWKTLEGKDFEPEDGQVGFVYLITRKDTGRAYIGKKGLTRSVTKPPLKGKKRKRREKKESDWRSYWGSNKTLQEDVAELGPEWFKRQVIMQCRSKAEMSYFEAKYQLLYDVLLHPDAYYNEWISLKVTSAHMRSHAKKIASKV